jgi:hypothetical protein
MRLNQIERKDQIKNHSVTNTRKYRMKTIKKSGIEKMKVKIQIKKQAHINGTT